MIAQNIENVFGLETVIVCKFKSKIRSKYKKCYNKNRLH